MTTADLIVQPTMHRLTGQDDRRCSSFWSVSSSSPFLPTYGTANRQHGLTASSGGRGGTARIEDIRRSRRPVQERGGLIRPRTRWRLRSMPSSSPPPCLPLTAPLPISMTFRKVAGSTVAALFLSQCMASDSEPRLLQQQRRVVHPKPKREWTEETAESKEHGQRHENPTSREHGLIEVERRGYSDPTL